MFDFIRAMRCVLVTENSDLIMWMVLVYSVLKE